MKINDITMTNTDVEVTPLHVIPKAMFGVIIDETVPNYFLVKFANDDGFLFFTRYAIVSQKVMAMLASDRPISASTVVGLQAMFNIDFADIFDGNFFTKNLGALVSNPFANLFNVLSPTGYDMVKGAYNRL